MHLPSRESLEQTSMCQRRGTPGTPDRLLRQSGGGVQIMRGTPSSCISDLLGQQQQRINQSI